MREWKGMGYFWGVESSFWRSAITRPVRFSLSVMIARSFATHYPSLYLPLFHTYAYTRKNIGSDLPTPMPSKFFL